MSDRPEENTPSLESELTEQIGAKEERKLKAADNAKHSIWFGLGMFGMVGWSVAIPTIIGVAIGVWLDATFPGRVSWTLTMLFLGVVVGGIIAWNWVQQEGKPD